MAKYMGKNFLCSNAYRFAKTSLRIAVQTQKAPQNYEELFLLFIAAIMLFCYTFDHVYSSSIAHRIFKTIVVQSACASCAYALAQHDHSSAVAQSDCACCGYQ
jgi:hypothetical protein